jgi:hypothetical protein
MKLNIRGQIRQIQSAFSAVFPYLKIEFFHNGRGVNRLSPLTEMIPGEKLIGNYIKINSPGEIEVNSYRTVAELEREFSDKFGLEVQVYRKSGDLWIETSKSDGWTLDRQNEEGRLSCQEKFPKTIEEKWEEDRWDSD